MVVSIIIFASNDMVRNVVRYVCVYEKTNNNLVYLSVVLCPDG
jgi:hypothetical protein